MLGPDYARRMKCVLSAGRHAQTQIFSFVLQATCMWLATISSTAFLCAQDLSWVDGAMARSKQVTRENLPAWQYDPRVAAGSSDATLHGLAAASADRVWAVGDRGLILASPDGGRTWTQQNSGTTLNLYAVAFVDEQEGFAVGGIVQPLSQMSVGIVLATDNAGATWRSMHKGSLPRLTGLTMGPRGQLKAWGDYSTIYSSAVLESLDKGQSWQSVNSALGHIQSVASHGRGHQIAVDRAGRVAQLPSQSTTIIQQLSPPTSPISSLEYTGTQWLAVGENGTLATSKDGSQWVDRALPLSPDARAACSFRCATVFENHVWVSGAPGTILMHSADSGETWTIQPTDQAWPVNAIRFFDRHRGWAVTDAGTILATRDGGATWFPQRQPVKRLGLQAIAASPSNVSWPALADAAWQARQATALSVVHRENMEDAVDFLPDAPATLSALGVQSGLVAAQQSSSFPLPDRRVRNALISSELYRETSSSVQRRGQIAATVSHQLAMQLRMGRPTVVLVDEQTPDEVSRQFTDAVARAITRASRNDPEYAWLQTELLLAPWQASKLFTSASAHKADFTIAHDQLLRDSGLSINDVLGPLFGFSGTHFQSCGLRCLQSGGAGTISRNALFHLSDRQPESTRSVDLSKVGNLQLVMGRVHREKAWQSLLPTASSSEESMANWLKKLESIIEKTPRHEVGQALINLAQACSSSNDWLRWHAILQRAIDYAPQSDAARWSALAELRYGASDERIAWEWSNSASPSGGTSSGGVQLATGSTDNRIANAWESTPFEAEQTARNATDKVVPAAVQMAVNISGESTSGSEVRTAAAQSLPVNAVRTVSTETPVDPKQALRVASLKQAVADFNKLVESDKPLILRPDVQLAHYARRRALAELAGEPAPDAGVLQLLSSNSQMAGWRQVAEQELGLASGRPTLPTWTARALPTDQPPKLDGRADDACWLGAVPIELTSPFNADALRATTAQFAYDAEYLYVLLKCPLVSARGSSSQRTAAPRGGRTYDMSLDGSDYVQLNFDTDRDYVSACELAVSQAGHTFDRCCQNSLWNPRWYVAADQGSQIWSAELAIKLADLTTASSVRGRAWAISAFRYIPQWDVQSWSQLRSSNPRLQGNGLLVFER